MYIVATKEKTAPFITLPYCAYLGLEQISSQM